MACYVDELRTWGAWRYGASSRLYADTPEELHNMALRLGLRHEWFQPLPISHYDVTTSVRARAIGFGAYEVTARDMVRMVRMRTVPAEAQGV